MKILSILFIYILSLALSNNLYAKDIPVEISGQVEDAYCSEIHPYIGDQCVVLTTDKKTGEKYGLVFGDYDWMDLHVLPNKEANSNNGRNFSVDYCDPIFDSEVIRENKQLNSGYHYVYCSAELFSWGHKPNAAQITVKVHATIDSVQCGEASPYAGDLCIIYSTHIKTGKKYGFVFSDYDWANKYLKDDRELEELSGQSFKIKSCRKIYDPLVISDLQMFANPYEIYECPINNFSWQ